MCARTRYHTPQLHLTDARRSLDILESGVAHLDCISHPAQAGAREPEIRKMGVYNSTLGIDGKTVSVYAFPPLSVALIGGVILVLHVPENEINESNLQATTVVRINLAARPVLGLIGPLLPELTRLFGRQSDVHQSLPRDQDIGDRNERSQRLGRGDEGNVAMLLVAGSVQPALMNPAGPRRASPEEQTLGLEVRSVQGRENRRAGRAALRHDA